MLPDFGVEYAVYMMYLSPVYTAVGHPVKAWEH
jgi:hypothetical protein